MDELMNDLNRVGPQKPLGYLPLDTMRDICGVDCLAVKDSLEVRGLSVLVLCESVCHIGSGALYAYDEAALAGLLKDKQPLFDRINLDHEWKLPWSCDPTDFVLNVAMYSVSDPELYALIGKAFADARFTAASHA